MTSDRILVVDDNKEWRAMCESLLAGQGYIVTAVGDYASALSELAHSFYPVVMIDLRLLGEGDTKGLSLLQEIERLWPNAIVQKVVVSGWHLTAEETQKISEAVSVRSVLFFAKSEAGRNPLALVGIVRHAFARLRRPVSCFITNTDCMLDIEPRLKQVFVAMPYSIKSPGIVANMDDVYEYGIKRALQDLGYSTLRAVDKAFIGGLICNVCQGIQESVMCIADITDWNPNVLFELGLMYGCGKLTAILKHAKSEVFTNLKFALYLEYDSIASLKSQLYTLCLRLQEQPGCTVLPPATSALHVSCPRKAKA